jgi:hypothetical protein
MPNPLKIVGPPAPPRQRVFADLCVRDLFCGVAPYDGASLYVKTEEVFMGSRIRNALELDSGKLVSFAPDHAVWQVRGTLTWEEIP